MRVVVTGASGNVGSALVERLATEPKVESILGICRREHGWRPPKAEWRTADVEIDDLVTPFKGADVVVHLAWLFHPMRKPNVTWNANAEGTRRVLDAVDQAGVGAIVVASSVGAYSPRESLDAVDESWPTHGLRQTAYSREKAMVERLLDAFAVQHPDRRVVWLRPGFTFAERASAQQRRLFLGPLVPHALLKPGRVPVLPLPGDLRLQALDARDVADAYAEAVLRPVDGAFNLAADDGLGARELAEVLDSKWLPTRAPVLRAAVAAGFHARAVPVAPELFDLLMTVPVMRTARAHAELGWVPTRSSAEALQAFFTGLSHDSDVPTPPLARSSSGVAREHELATGLGQQA
jgi:nucleoside-diphosphate-sugar epimerase